VPEPGGKTEKGEVRMVTVIVIWGLAAITAAALAGFAAGWKNRDYSYWMAWSFLFPPLLLWLVLMPKKQGPRPRRPSLDELDRIENRDLPH
jgi:hypothetical protein